ncbi:MAG: BamA/TamA family outer membrane protein [candidate division WOR-3 bacterium]
MISAIALPVILGVVTGMEAGSIRFEGNRAFGARVLLTIVQVRKGMPVSEALLDQDSRSLEWFYRSQGFMNVRVEKMISGTNAQRVITFRINEGPRSRISAIVINGNLSFSAERLRKVIPFSEYEFFTADKIAGGIQSLREFYLNQGYPFVQVDESLDHYDTLITVRYEIVEGPLCYVRSVFVRGNQRVRTQTILQALEIKPGEKFSRSRLELAKRRLYATRLFTRALYYIYRPDTSTGMIDLRQPPEESVNIRFDVVEQEQQGVGLGFGFETPPNRLLFSFDWEHNNFLNRGQRLSAGISYSPDFAGSHRINADGNYRIPYLFFQRVDFQTHPFFYYEQLDSSRLRDYGIETGMGRDLLPPLHLGMFNRLRFVADTVRGVTNSLALNLIYDTRNDFLEPHRGIYLQPLFEVAGGPFRGDNDFIRIRLDSRWYQSVNQFVIALRFAGGRVMPYGRLFRVPYYEEFSLGGSSSLRGYPERALGPDTAAGGRYGPVVINGNFELRTPYILRWVGVVGFLDCGQVADQNDLRLRGLEVGAGGGIRIKTPIGPVRFDWGKRLIRAPAGDRGRFYIGILHTF